MLNHLKRLLFLHYPLVIIFLMWLVVILINAESSKWLLSWDSLLPELDLELNFKRALVPAWQEFQGLGLVGGMGHGSDITRLLFLAFNSIFLPTNVLRLSWTALMLLLGPVGAYFLSRYLLIGEKTKKKTISISLAPGITGLFYLLNIATIQYFFVPLETFSSFYGFLPWLIWSVIVYLDNKKISSLFTFFLICVAATSAFYVQTMFVVFSIILAITLLTSFIYQVIHKKNWRIEVKSTLLVIGVLFATQFFWMGPVSYYTLTNSQTTVNSKQNLIATPESIQMNQSYGNFKNIAQLKGYWFSYTTFSPENQPEYLFDIWRKYFEQRHVELVSYALFFIAVVGIVIALFQKPKWGVAIFGICLFTLIMLSTGSGLLGKVFFILTDNVPLFGQMFRVAFTKWSIVMALMLSLGLGYSLNFLFSYKLFLKGAGGVIAAVLTAGLIMVPILPVFQGNLFYKSAQISLPEPYLQLISFFKTQPSDARIVVLPSSSFWGWSFTDWGYQGSGFLWYGIQQPILDRNFDVWSPYNETFYQQLATNLHGRNSQGLLNVLEQYDVSYILIDESIIFPGAGDDMHKLENTQMLLDAFGAELIWEKDFLSVYDVSNIANKQFVSAPSSYHKIEQDSLLYSRIDRAYSEFGSYISTADKNISNQLVYPFSFLGEESSANTTVENDLVKLRSPKIGLHEYSSLFIPPVATGSGYPVNAQISRGPDGVIINFASAGLLRWGTETMPLPQLPAIEVPVNNLTSDKTVTVHLNGQPIVLNQGNEESWSWVTLIAHLPIPISVEIEGETEIHQSNLPINIWSNLESGQYIPFDSNSQEISLELPALWHIVDIHSLDTENCDVLKRGSISKRVGLIGATYTSENYGAACSGTSLPVLNTKIGGLLRFQGENQRARSLKFYLTNQGSNRADLEALLPTGSYDVIYNVLPWSLLNFEEYSLNWETRSFGQPSENYLRQIQVLPLAMERILSTRLETTQNEKVTNDIQIKVVRKIGPYQYGVDLYSNEDNGLLTLSQGYDPGWIALSKKENSNYLLNWSILPHVTYNGWANGWLLPQGNQHIILIFWPQLLTFIGYAVLFITFVWFVKTLLKKRTTSDG